MKLTDGPLGVNSGPSLHRSCICGSSQVCLFKSWHSLGCLSKFVWYFVIPLEQQVKRNHNNNNHRNFKGDERKRTWWKESHEIGFNLFYEIPIILINKAKRFLHLIKNEGKSISVTSQIFDYKKRQKRHYEKKAR